MRVQDVMTEVVQTVSPGTAAEEAWNLMRAKGIHHLVVTDGGPGRGRAVGSGHRRTSGNVSEAES